MVDGAVIVLSNTSVVNISGCVVFSPMTTLRVPYQVGSIKVFLLCFDSHLRCCEC